MKTPPCAHWNMWTGPEIEGQDSAALGVKTLFVRKGDPYPYIVNSNSKFMPGLKRVWFCKEYTDMGVVLDIANFMPVCLETTPLLYPTLPKAVIESEKITLFLKVSTPLKQGDHVCVGPAFDDESFVVGKERGNKVAVQQYLNDRRLE